MRFPRERRPYDDDLEEELRAHIEMAVRERTARGESEADARAAARREFGNYAHVKEVTREHGISVWAEWLERIRQAAGLAFRRLRRSPGFTLTAIGSLAIGMGATISMFSVVDAVDLRPLPFASERSLVLFTMVAAPGSEDCRQAVPCPLRRVSADDVDELRKTSPALADLALYDLDWEYRWSHGAETEPLSLAEVSPNFFSVFGVQPRVGRGFLPEDTLAGAPPAVILSHELWQSRFASNVNVIGQTMSIVLVNWAKTVDAVVVGVMPAGFRFLNERAWMARAARGNVSSARLNHYRGSVAVGRLAEGHSLIEAQAGARLFTAHGAVASPRENRALEARIERLDGPLLTSIPARTGALGAGRGRFLLLGAVALTLAIALANVAGLFLVRASRRQHEYGVRTALGASRARLLQETLVEAMTIVLPGGALGVALSFLGVHVVGAALGMDAFVGSVAVNGHALLFAVALVAVTGLVLGLTPASQPAGCGVEYILGSGATRATQPRATLRAQGIFVVVQVAAALTLFIGGTLLLKELYRLRYLEPQYDPVGLLSVSVELPVNAWTDPVRQEAIASDAFLGVSGLQEIQSASMLAPSFRALAIPGRRDTLDALTVLAVSADFFRTVRTPLRGGRPFQASDGSGAAQVAIVDETAAAQFWPKENPVGKVVMMRRQQDSVVLAVTIVGVVAAAKLWVAPLASPAEPVFYVPYTQASAEPRKAVVIFARARVVAPRLLSDIRAVVYRVTNEPVDETHIVSLLANIRDELRRQRFDMIAFTSFAAFALLLAGVGIYAVAALRTSLRTTEIGIRMALGAGQGNVLRFVSRESIILALQGLLAGLGAAWVVSRLFVTMLVTTNPRDPLVFGGCALLTGIIVLAAGYLPARRAASVDPVIALRHV